jgi:autotransporter-associated beta strand protein
VALLFWCSQARAVTRTWADVGTDFATAANWGGTAPANNLTGDIGSFNSVLNFQPVLSANRSINGLAFTTSATGAITLSGTGTLSIGGSGINNASTSGQKSITTALIAGASQSFTNNGLLSISGSTLSNTGFTLTLTGTGAGGTLASTVSGTGGITKAGTGTWVISGANTGYSGTTNVSAGTLRATNASALGTGGVTLGAGTLQLANDSATNFGNNATIAGTSTVNSDVATLGNAGVTHTLGTLNVTATSTLNISSGANVGSGNAGVTFGATTLGANATFNTGNNTVLTLGALSDSAARTITKTGAGTLVLGAAAGTWTNNSNLTINNGTVKLGANNALSAGATLTNVTVNGTTVGSLNTFDLNGFNQTIAALTFGGTGATSTSTNIVNTNGGTLTLGGTVAYSATNNPLGGYLIGQVDLGAASRTFNVGDSTTAPYDLIVSANLSSLAGAFGITKTGAGTMVLSGNNSYTGGTTVSTGVLNIQSNTALGTSAAGTTVSVGAALQLQGGLTVTGEPLSVTGTGITGGSLT